MDDATDEQGGGGGIRKLLLLLFAIPLLISIASAAGAAIARSKLQSSGDETTPEGTWVTIFDGGERANRAPDLRSLTWIAWFGGGVLDLRGATPAADGATLTLRAVMGGGQILIPPHWRVETRAKPIMGGLQVHDDAAGTVGSRGDEHPVLTVDAVMVMGGFEIRREDPE